jgi:hypothetical protein
MVDVLEGSTTTSSMSAPEYVKTLASALKAYTDTSGSVVPVRFLHEMNMAEKPWQSIDPDTYRRLFRQWASILHAGNPRLRTVWCIAGGGARDFEKYYPGDTAVDWVGCDIYPGMRPAATEYEFSNLDAAHDLAGRRSKPFVIPEFSRPSGTIDEVPDDPRYLQRLGEWMVSSSRLVAVCNFEVYNHNGDWRLSDGTHQQMLKMWRSYARRPIFEGDL